MDTGVPVSIRYQELLWIGYLSGVNVYQYSYSPQHVGCPKIYMPILSKSELPENPDDSKSN